MGQWNMEAIQHCKNSQTGFSQVSDGVWLFCSCYLSTNIAHRNNDWPVWKNYAPLLPFFHDSSFMILFSFSLKCMHKKCVCQSQKLWLAITKVVVGVCEINIWNPECFLHTKNIGCWLTVYLGHVHFVRMNANHDFRIEYFCSVPVDSVFGVRQQYRHKICSIP